MNQVTKRRGLRSQRVYDERDNFSADKHFKMKMNEESNSDCEENLSENEENSLEASEDYSHKSVKRKLPKMQVDIKQNLKLNLKQNLTNQADNKYLYLCIFLFIILVSLSCYYYYSVLRKNGSDCSQIPSCSFKNHYKQLQEEFQKQNKWSWKVIRTAINSVINSTRHEQPAVILLVASERAGTISSCLANRLAYSLEESFNNRKGYPRLNPLEGTTDLEMKERIDKVFTESFENNDHHVILLERLDALAADSAMILHSYCDHENAPYKDVVILMTATTNASVESSELTVKKMDQIAWKHLDNRWEALHEEKRVALLSRITTSVALILPEDKVPPTCTQYTTH